MSYSDEMFDSSDEEQSPASIAVPSTSTPKTTLLRRVASGLSWIMGTSPSQETSTAEGRSDVALRQFTNEKLREQSSRYVTRRSLRVHIATWNVASEPPPSSGLEKWLVGGTDPETLPDIVVVGLQEVEVGGTAFLLETTDSSVSWMEAIIDTLNKVALPSKRWYKKIEMIQLVGITLIFISRTDHVPHVRNIRKAVSRTGVIGGVGGNKGAIGLRATIYHKRCLFICAHFAAHKGKCEKRNANFHDAMGQLKFPLSDEADDELDFALGSPSIGVSRRALGSSFTARLFPRKVSGQGAVESEERMLATHDYTFFFGDLNYRLENQKYQDIMQCIDRKAYDDLLFFDELRQQTANGVAFDGFSEPEIHFPPTYKFDKGRPTYDSVKRREPAWTDRVLFRALGNECGKGRKRSNSLPADLSSAPALPASCNTLLNEVKVVKYDSDTSLMVSDHRPVGAYFDIQVTEVDRASADVVLEEIERSAAKDYENRAFTRLRRSQTATADLPVYDEDDV